ncbi:hypothetical protein V6N13_097674 [Hibiscus sabdariffa]|uniref:Uncharacterized protein n=2 Tax=Hibiscus sabdariffa TaxID=183260 RepID=A0ABR2AK43_9ROSI
MDVETFNNVPINENAMHDDIVAFFVVPAVHLQSVATATTTKDVNTDVVLIAAELITTFSTKDIGIVTTTILELDEEMGKTFLPTPTMLSEFDEWLSKQSSLIVSTKAQWFRSLEALKNMHL